MSLLRFVALFLTVLLLGGIDAFAQTPTVTTNPPSAITDLAATFNGSVNPNGLNLVVSFAYGTTTSYGSSATPSPSTASGTTTVSRSVRLTNLLPGTTYHYQFTVHKTGESNPHYEGADQTFTTAAAATPPTIGSVSTLGVSPTSVGVQASSVFSGSSPTTVVFEYGLTASYGSTVNASGAIPTNSSVNPNVALTSLSQGTTYHYRCKATNNEGTATSADAAFTTTFAPTIVTGTASNVTDISATLNGMANANNGSVNVSFDYGTTINYGSGVTPSSDTISGSSDTATAAAISHLQPNTTYHYRLRGAGSGGNYFGADATFTTGAPITPPSMDIARASFVNATDATLEVDTLNTGGAPTTLGFEFGTTTAYGSTVTYTPPFAASTTVYGASVRVLLTPGTTYHFRGKATSSVGTVYTADGTFTTPPLPIVATTAATGVGDITATFNGSISPNGHTYQLDFEFGTTTAYGFGMNPTPGTASGSGTLTPSATVSLQPNTTYHYRLRASDTGPTSYYGDDQTFTTGAPTTPPTVGVATAQSTTPTTATISISNVTAGASPATLVIDYGLTAGYGSTKNYFTTLATASSLSFDTITLVGLSPSTSYHYLARVSNGQGTAATTDATFTTQAPPVLTASSAGSITARTASLGGTINTHQGTFTMDFECGLTTSYGSTFSASPGTASGFFTTNVAGNATRLIPSTTYHYRLRAFDGVANYFYGPDVSFTTLSLIEYWRKQNFGSIANTGNFADNASFAGDGVPNLVKYALGLDPTVSSVQGLPAITLKTVGDATYLDYSFLRNPALVDLTYEVVVADSPSGPWTTIASSVAGASPTGPGFVAEIPGSGGKINLEICDTVSTTDATRRFLELRISR